MDAFLENKHLLHVEKPHIDVSFPKVLFELLKTQYGIKKAIELCQNLNEQAPTTLRTNLLQTTRDKLVQMLKNEDFELTVPSQTTTAIILKKRSNLFSLPAFKKGYFEMQDLGSQIICEKIELEKGDHVLDYCAGSGGKTLGLAPQLQGTGQFYLHDVRKKRSMRLKKE